LPHTELAVTDLDCAAVVTRNPKLNGLMLRDNNETREMHHELIFTAGAERFTVVVAIYVVLCFAVANRIRVL